MAKKTKIRRKSYLEKEIVATLTIIDAPGMTSKSRAEIAVWLQRQATGLTVEGHLYAKRFYATYRM